MNNHIRRNQRFDCEQHNGIIYVKLGNLTDTALGRHWADSFSFKKYLLVSHEI